MVKAVALNTLHVCRKPGVKNDQNVITQPAQVDTVPAGSIVDLEQDQFNEFLAVGAVRKASQVDVARQAEDGSVPVGAEAVEGDASGEERQGKRR